MNSLEYKTQLEKLIECLPAGERDEAVSFYMEAIADRIDEGMTEEEAVAATVSPVEAAKAILSEKIIELQDADSCHCEDFLVDDLRDAYNSLPSPDASHGEQTQECQETPGFCARLRERKLSALEWVAVVVTSPLWLSLAVAAIALMLGVAVLVLALYLCVWILIACVWIVGAACVLAFPAGIILAIWGLQIESLPYVLVNAGYALFLFGAGMWILKGALVLTKAFWRCQSVQVTIMNRKWGRIETRRDDEVTSEDASASTTESARVNHASSGATHKVFFRVCLIMLLAGIVCVAAAFLLSGFDWHIFLTSVYDHGNVYLGGVKVEHPETLLFSPYAILLM